VVPQRGIGNSDTRNLWEVYYLSNDLQGRGKNRGKEKTKGGEKGAGRLTPFKKGGKEPTRRRTVRGKKRLMPSIRKQGGGEGG